MPPIRVLSYGLDKSHSRTYLMTFLSIYFSGSVSSSSNFVKSVLLVNTSIPKSFDAVSTLEFGSSSFFYNSTSKADFIVANVLFKK